jgi:hypothetical protein
VGPPLGGAGLFNNGGTVHLVWTTVTQNVTRGTGPPGGGLWTTGGTVRITHSRFTNNGAFVGGGLNAAGGTVSIAQSTIAGNTADTGAGILIGGDCCPRSQAVLTMIDSTVVDNRANTGGGLAILDGSLLQITNSTVARNSSILPGGGIDNGGTTVIRNSTIADNNVRASGGGIHVGGGTLTLQNAILARNSVGSFPNDCFGPVTSLGTNLIGDPIGCTITLQPSDLTGDPGLDAFTDTGTPGNGHFPLLPTSQAIDTGNDAVCPRRDQIGQRRIGPCDIGAIRFLDNTDLQHEDDPATAAQATK